MRYFVQSRKFGRRIFNTVSNHKGVVATVAVIGGTISQAHADIVSYDPATGLSWDMSLIIAGVIGVIVLCITGASSIHLLKQGWAAIKKMFKA